MSAGPWSFTEKYGEIVRRIWTRFYIGGFMVRPSRAHRVRRSVATARPTLGWLLIAGCAVVAACSSESKTRGNTGGSDTTGAGGTTGIIFGEDGGIIGSGGSTSGSVACDAAKGCPQDQICVKTMKGGICEPKGSPCSTNNDCKDDTFCCSGTCRVDGAAGGVCVPFGDQKPVDETCTDPLPTHKRVLTSPLIADLPNDSGAAAEIIVVSSDSGSGAIEGDGTGGVIRI